IRRLRDAHVLVGRLSARACFLDRRIVLQRRLNGIVERQRSGRRGLCVRARRTHQARQYSQANQPARQVTDRALTHPIPPLRTPARLTSYFFAAADGVAVLPLPNSFSAALNPSASFSAGPVPQ